VDIIEKIQKLPEAKKKIILWATVVVLGLVLLFFWSKKAQNKLGNFRAEEIKEELNLPNLEVPEFNMQDIDYEEEQ
jgi:hypothetical protein